MGGAESSEAVEYRLFRQRQRAELNDLLDRTGDLVASGQVHGLALTIKS